MEKDHSMHHAKRKVSGFTMLEIMLSVAITMLFSSLILASIPTFSRQTKTSDAASAILIAAQDVRQKSSAGKQFFITGKFPSYGLYLDSTVGSNKSVTLYADCVDDDNSDGKLDTGDTFIYNPASSACGGTNPNGLVENRTFDSQVKISQLRLIANGIPGFPKIMRKAYIEFVSPQPSVWISGYDLSNAYVPPIEYGELEITIQDDQNGNTRTVHLWTSGRMDIQ